MKKPRSRLDLILDHAADAISARVEVLIDAGIEIAHAKALELIAKKKALDKPPARNEVVVDAEFEDLPGKASRRARKARPALPAPRKREDAPDKPGP